KRRSSARLRAMVTRRRLRPAHRQRDGEQNCKHADPSANDGEEMRTGHGHPARAPGRRNPAQHQSTARDTPLDRHYFPGSRKQFLRTDVEHAVATRSRMFRENRTCFRGISRGNFWNTGLVNTAALTLELL